MKKGDSIFPVPKNGVTQNGKPFAMYNIINFENSNFETSTVPDRKIPLVFDLWIPDGSIIWRVPPILQCLDF